MNYNSIFSPALKEAKRLIYGNEDYPSKSKSVLNKVGSAKVKTAVIIRNPISQVITEFLKQASNTPYDKLFHLAIVFETDKGQVLIEKNEVLNITQAVQLKEGFETYPVEIDKELTIQQILDKTKDYQGGKFFKYSAYDNNCQDFILALLKSNNLGDEDVYRFVKQDTEEIFRTNPFIRKLANTITDIAGRFTGRGKSKKNLRFDRRPSDLATVGFQVGGLIVKANPYGDWK